MVSRETLLAVGSTRWFGELLGVRGRWRLTAKAMRAVSLLGEQNPPVAERRRRTDAGVAIRRDAGGFMHGCCSPRTTRVSHGGEAGGLEGDTTRRWLDAMVRGAARWTRQVSSDDRGHRRGVPTGRTESSGGAAVKMDNGLPAASGKTREDL